MMKELEEKIKYSFVSKELLLTALTHSSFANEQHCNSNERLEFLGDSVLGMVTAKKLYLDYPKLPEGKMTKIRAELVCELSLWQVADQLSLGTYLRLGKGEEATGGRKRHSILADCVEALIAAIYLDGGMDAASRFIDEFILSKLSKGLTVLNNDWKTELQELVQQKPGRTITYEMIDESGPDHLKLFTSAVFVDGIMIGSGSGYSKKEAEQMAAENALNSFETI